MNKIQGVFLAGAFGFLGLCAPSALGASPAEQAAAEQEVRAAAPFKKVFIIVLENEDVTSAMDQPYLAELASRGASLTNFRAVTHPSQGNYFALTAGSYLGMTLFWGDKTVTKDVSNIADLLEAKGYTWKSYAEDYPGNCFLGNSGKYKRKHNPFISFKNIQENPARCARIVNADQLEADITDGNLPDYSFYVPNMDNDGHDTDVAYASRWLQKAFDGRLSDPRFIQDMLFVVTFDESEQISFKNQIYTVFYGPNVVPGTKIDTRYNLYSLLRTIEDVFGLGTLGRRDAKASSITGIWR